MSEYRWLRRWGRVGEIVLRWKRRTPWLRPMFVAYSAVDGLIWVWWRWGAEYEGIGRVGAYRAAEGALGRGYERATLAIMRWLFDHVAH